MSNKTSTPTTDTELAALQRKVVRMEKRLAKLEAERDEAREAVISKRMGSLVRSEHLYMHRGEYLPSESIRLIRLGRLTFEQAIDDRNSRYPLFTYGEGLALADAYRMAV